MHCTRKITDDIIWVGGNDRKLSMFEGYYPVPEGISYNSYFLDDTKTVLFDTVDKSASAVFKENVKFALNGRKLDYLVIHHMEPDHSATISDIVREYPNVTIVCSPKTVPMLKQFFGSELEFRILQVNEGDVLETGKHTLSFISAPMVHWPEVIMTYDKTEKLLFSADAFGSFTALNGGITDTEDDFDFIEARRYYTNIVGKYGNQVKAVLKKASELEINMICPLHGLVLKKNIAQLIDKYAKWSSYIPEEKGVLIAYSSVYGNTENAAEAAACILSELGVKTKVMDTSMIHSSYILSEAFRFSHILFASTTYNSGVFVTMETLISELASHNIQNRFISVIENGSWAPVCGKLIKAKFEKSKNISFIGDIVTVKSAVNSDSEEQLLELTKQIAESVKSL